MSQLNTALTNMDKEMKTVYSIGGLPHFQKIQEEVLFALKKFPRSICFLNALKKRLLWLKLCPLHKAAFVQDNIHKVRKEKSRFRLVSRLMRGRRKEGDGRPNAPSGK